MRGIGAALALVAAALLVSCKADAHQDLDIQTEHSGLGYDTNERKPEHGDNEEPLHPLTWPPHMDRRFHYRTSPNKFMSKRNFDEIDQTMMPFPMRKRVHLYAGNNLDANNRVTSSLGSDLNQITSKRNFDEIDQTMMPFPMGKRAYMYRRNMDPINEGTFVMRYNFPRRQFRSGPEIDEIDLSPFPIGS